MRTANYDKFPCVPTGADPATCQVGWEAIGRTLRARLATVDVPAPVLVVECYQGVLPAVAAALQAQLAPALWLDTATIFRDEAAIGQLVQPDVTDDPIFGFATRLRMADFLNPARVAVQRQLASAQRQGLVVAFGPGASLLLPGPDVLVYADLARWEIQQRMRRHEVDSLGLHNRADSFASLYKQGFFVDWRVCDHLKKQLMPRWDYVLDTNTPAAPKLVEGPALNQALAALVHRPFRVVPFFDPGPWGGQWMKEVCDLDRSAVNYAWCFDCVPEENSLLLGFGEAQVEVPAVNLVYQQPDGLLGPKVHARFGDEFPIRFDFLDTMQGGNLSLQVHPLTEFIQQEFGIPYTQDESYYLLDAEPDAVVYLGLRDDVDPPAMLAELRQAQAGGAPFEADRHVQRWPVRKHDHVSIPAGTVHCSGAGSMVLEISATPFIFTFKLWDWGRLGLDGRPRPINIDRGAAVMQWDRTATWVRQHARCLLQPLGQEPGWREERTGLNELEFIETRRHWFTGTVPHDTQGIVHVLNLVQGREAVVESPTGAFAPFVVHYAETFIVPAAVGAYTIRPHGEAIGTECATLKAYVRC